MSPRLEKINSEFKRQTFYVEYDRLKCFIFQRSRISPPKVTVQKGVGVKTKG